MAAQAAGCQFHLRCNAQLAAAPAVRAALEERATPEALVWGAWTLRLLHYCICLGMVLQAGRASQLGAVDSGQGM